MTGHDPGRDEGFTLVELLLSVSIVVVIISSLSGALIVFLRNSSDALARDDHSGGSALTTTYLDRDVASADTVTTGGTTCSGTTNLLAMSWSDFTASSAAPSPVPGTSLAAAYTVVSDPSATGRYRLQRVSCQAGAVVERTTLLGNLPSSSTSATVALAADTGCPGSGQALTLTVAVYGSDSTTGNAPYRFRACTRTRVTP